MVSELYTAIAPALPIAALLVSAISLLVTMRNRADQKQADLVAKNAELILKLAQREAKLGHLAFLYTQKKNLLLRSFDAVRDARELKRIDESLLTILEAQLNGQKLHRTVRESQVIDLAALENMLSTTNEGLVHDSEQLVREQADVMDMRT